MYPSPIPAYALPPPAYHAAKSVDGDDHCLLGARTLEYIEYSISYMHLVGQQQQYGIRRPNSVVLNVEP